MSKFEVLVLGNSSAVPAYGRHPTSHLVNIHEHFLLIDCGEGTQERLSQYKCKPHKIQHIFISHLHGDHYFGLFGLITSMNLSGRKDKLTIYSPAGVSELVAAISQLSNSVFNYEIDWKIIKPNETQTLLDDNVKSVIAFPLNHRIPTFGFLVKEKPGKRIFKSDAFGENPLEYEIIRQLKDAKDYTYPDGTILKYEVYTSPPSFPRTYAFCSDTLYEPAVIPHIAKADLLYHEATYTELHKDKARENHHSTALDAARIAAMAEVKKLIIGHFSSRYKQLDHFTTEARGIFKNTQLAEEGTWYPV